VRRSFLRVARAVTLLCVSLLALGSSSRIVAQQVPEDSLLLYAVTVNRTPMQNWGPGAGIYLGHGLVITAAHVVGMTLFTRPKVIILEQELSTRTIKRGDFEGVDLTLLSFDDSQLPLRYRLRQNPICKQDPYPGEEVVTIVPGHAVHSHVISPNVLPPWARKFSTVIADVAETGNSGSGVFDFQHKCLLGIMSRKISLYVINRTTKQRELKDIAKYFVPASVLASFIPAEYKLMQK